MTVIGSPRYSFLAKLFGAAALIGLADLFFYDNEPGWTLGGFALAWTLVLGVTRPDVRHHRAARAALVVALLFGVMLVDDPGPLDWCLFGLALMSASLLPLRRFDDAIRWGLRIALHGIFGLATPFRDARRLARRCPSRALATVSGLLILPVLGGTLFLYLFAQANPLIAGAFAAIRFPNLSAVIFHAVFWLIVLLAVWPALRPHRAVLRFDFGGVADTACARHLPVAALILSLVTFNAIFAVQNALDLAFLWSGAALPAGVTPAEYAHRGAYPLIVTALLAGAFVLLAARPDSDGARSPLVRRLILLWVTQNLLLVASSMLRTLDYIAASMLTSWRIAALLWMGLVATGLILITWRMVTGRSVAWLINANALAAGLVLAGVCAVDLGAIAADWNVRHARRGDALDLCYLEGLGPSALLPLIDLERRAGGPVLRGRVHYLIDEAMGRLERDQRDWHSWTWRGARWLAAAEARVRPHAAPPPLTDGWIMGCGGLRIRIVDDAPPPAPAPLTKSPRP
ncbi:DUF4173 domain-containing protein [Sphingomonas sp.]|uniref:DUF4153 domain-containing protein n=1 Tax=Sphingomonas sp. TaxID=28214 RepID=UPI00289DCBAE|nr:DUF4173 domain-containing protein [Sphingomonas sp.]